MPSSKYTIASSRYYTRMFTHLLKVIIIMIIIIIINNKFNISASEMLQKKINRLYYIFPNDFTIAKSCTCAGFPVASVTWVASTAV